MLGQTTTVPFCSERCRQVDLKHWLDEVYFLPDQVQDDEIDEAE